MALIDNLVAYYKLDESSGNAVDSVNAYNLTNNGTTAYATGLIGNCADFGSSNSTKSLTNTGNPATTINGGDFTISFWVNPAGTSTLQCPTEIQCTTNGAWFRAVAALDIANNRWYAHWHGGGQVVSTQTFNAGTWYHVVITNTSGTLELFGNAVSKGTTATHYGGNLSATDAFHVNNTTGDGYGDGKQDEIGVWNRALSGAEITSLYNGGAGLQYPFTPTSAIKTINGLAKASVKTVNGLAIASVKNWGGLA